MHESPSAIRFFGRRSTARRRPTSDERRIARWQRRPILPSILIAAPGIALMLRSHQTRRSPASSSSRPAGRRRAAGSLPQPRSCSAPQRSRPSRRYAWSARWLRQKQASRPARSRQRSSVLVTAEAGTLDELQQRSHQPPARANRLRLELRRARCAAAGAPRGSSSRSTSTSPATPTSTRGAPPWRRASLRAPTRSATSRGPPAPAPPAPHDPHPSDLLLDGLAQLIVEGLASGGADAAAGGERVPRRRAGCSSGERWPRRAAAALWDMESFHAVITRQLQLARDSGALALLATALQGAGIVLSWTGDFQRSGVVGRGGRCGVRRDRRPHRAVRRDAARGLPRGAKTRPSPCSRATIEDATASGEGLGVQYARWATALLYNGLGPLRGGAGRSAAGERRRARALRLSLGARGAGGGGRPSRERGPRRRGADRATRRRHEPERRRLGARNRGAITGAGERGRRGRDRCTWKRSLGSAVRRSVPSSPAPTSSTASGSAAKTAAWTHASSSASPTRCSATSAPTRSPSEPAASLRRPA